MDLIDNDAFWEGKYAELRGKDLRLPVECSQWSIRAVLDEIDCRAEGCSECCRHYKTLQVSTGDIDRLRERCGVDIRPFTKPSLLGTMHFDISGGCRFLDETGCSVYRYRPDGCYFAPLQFGYNFKADGTPGDGNLHVRIECRPALRAVQEILRRGMKEHPGSVLREDLSLTIQGGERDGIPLPTPAGSLERSSRLCHGSP